MRIELARCSHGHRHDRAGQKPKCGDAGSRHGSLGRSRQRLDVTRSERGRRRRNRRCLIDSARRERGDAQEGARGGDGQVENERGGAQRLVQVAAHHRPRPGPSDRESPPRPFHQGPPEIEPRHALEHEPEAQEPDDHASARAQVELGVEKPEGMERGPLCPV